LWQECDKEDGAAQVKTVASLAWGRPVLMSFLAIALGTLVCTHPASRLTDIESGPYPDPYQSSPFSPTTSIGWTVPDSCHVTIEIYDASHQLVDTFVNTTQLAGEYHKLWNAGGAPSGVYFLRLTICGQVTTKKMVLLK
jgi:hypothetical protein